MQYEVEMSLHRTIHVLLGASLSADKPLRHAFQFSKIEL
jgi:hypothetical protein